ncbi:FliH/SctL family protein [Desulforamulus ruminis]|uniref:Flagellar assembly protein FliH/Type III secretion system HrpE n=1 Tax=Desulforamulus ruminis (strain ATCC 23193 / DSM 2154 / NCIMB 8452 / DL) TaxID=696281 RepID=F6DNR9_DESRL|nr:FliH/SctL family protein [Desulforamulus ruminis]AEG59514.1 Flagellar assembly protein FliH/Type III secretion system HrpE [Desulforamulus ruminis DSM 2154]
MYKIIKSAPVQEQDQILSLRELSCSKPDEEVEPVSPEEVLSRASQQANEIISKAQLEADDILRRSLAEAEKQAEQIKEEARQSGWQEGIHSAQTEADRIREEAREVLNQAKEAYRQMLDKLEMEVVDLAVDIAERVVMVQLSVEPQTIMQIAREALEVVKNRPLVTIYVNDADQAMVEKGRSQLLQGLPAKVELNILVDNGVQPGGCRVETDQGQVDATLETRWQEALKALYGREE